MNNQRLTIIILGLAGLAALGAGLGSYFAQQSTPRADIPQGLLWPNPKAFPEVTLYDHNGDDFTAADLQGHWSLVFFGFTHCPDICPMTLHTLDSLQARLTEQGIDPARLQVVFISVDPQRDTPERLAEYVHYFNPDFVGASGDKAAIKRLTRSIGAVYYIGPTETDGTYQVDHSASVFLFDPQARLVSVFTTPHQVEPMSERLLAIQHFIQQQRRL